MNENFWIITIFILSIIAFIPIAIEATSTEPLTEEQKTQELNNYIHKLINKERTENGRQPLTLNSQLTQLAIKHSKQMEKDQLMYHSSNNIEENVARIPQATNTIGCGNTRTTQSIADCVVQQWMDSYGHKQNLLTKTHTTTGIHAQCDNENCWITQNFR